MRLQPTTSKSYKHDIYTVNTKVEPETFLHMQQHEEINYLTTRKCKRSVVLAGKKHFHFRYMLNKLGN